ncbi:hypothetical protein ACEW7V_00360 [Areca yellow leaf disease phytoplasma]|uniref:hypothetical protein n=1 Tax=Areca yellow leaf disease phytoplasma TaxID=927614 RepID=UPI0035B5112E
MTEALQLAQAYQIVQNKNHKFNERVSELGTNFSGQKQKRLSMARGFLKKPDIYIFDDSFQLLIIKLNMKLEKLFEMKDQP